MKKISEELYIKIICISLKVLAWFLLIFGLLTTLATSSAVSSLFFLSGWIGVAFLVYFIGIFLVINLAIKIAEIVLRIKTKLDA